MRKIVFIAGQGGAGKTTLVNYFQKNPIKGWLFFDFDEGKCKKPQDLSKIKEWIKKQREFWLKEVFEEKYGKNNIVVFGVGLFSWELNLPNNVYFAYLSCEPEIRRKRLITRGTPDMWEPNKPSIDEKVKRLNQEGAKRFDTSSCSIEETVKEIKEWLTTIEFQDRVKSR